MNKGQKLYVEQRKAEKMARLSSELNNYQKAVQKFKTAKRDGEKAQARAEALALARKIRKIDPKAIDPSTDGLI